MLNKEQIKQLEESQLISFLLKSNGSPYTLYFCELDNIILPLRNGEFTYHSIGALKSSLNSRLVRQMFYVPTLKKIDRKIQVKYAKDLYSKLIKEGRLKIKVFDKGVIKDFE